MADERDASRSALEMNTKGEPNTRDAKERMGEEKMPDDNVFKQTTAFLISKGSAFFEYVSQAGNAQQWRSAFQAF